MERKHKIWLAVLLVLLIAAIAAVVYLNSERAASDAQLASASAQLEEERGKYLTLEESLAEATAQSEQLTADKEALEAELSTVEASLTEAQAALDAFNERHAEWHYLQSVVFYRKSWINESKKQLEIAMQMDGSNEKYRTAYEKLKEKIEYDKRRAENPQEGQAAQQQPQPDYEDQPQMGGGFCEQCATCCACNMLFNCCLNACCGCR